MIALPVDVLNDAKETISHPGAEDRAYLVRVMTRVAGPVLEACADTYLFNLAALTGQIGAIDEALGGYRAHGNNVSAKVKKGKVNKAALRKFLQREILTDQTLTAYGRKIGVNYRPGTLTSSLPHIQQLFLHQKLFKEDRCFGEESVIKDFLLYIKLLLVSDTLLFYKKSIIAGWSFMVMLLPKALAQHLVVIGYQFGGVLAATRVLSRPQGYHRAKSSSN